MKLPTHVSKGNRTNIHKLIPWRLLF